MIMKHNLTLEPNYYREHVETVLPQTLAPQALAPEAPAQAPQAPAQAPEAPAQAPEALALMEAPLSNTFIFKHPFTMIVAGPTSCGKTTWIKNLLQQVNSMISPPPLKITWFYKRWQPMYTEMLNTITNMHFIQGVSPTNIDSRYPSLYIFDDLMKDATKNQDICELYTEGSHHQNLSVICLMQNLYNKGKENRTMNLNSQYLVLFKNPRDQQQVSVLARQMYPNNSHYFMNKYQEATKKPYGYLLVDLKQETLEHERLRTNVIKGRNELINLQFANSNHTDSNSKVMDIKVKPYCIDCGLLYCSPMDLQRHLKRGCPEADIKEPPNKKYKQSDDESGWDNLINEAYAQHDDRYQKKVEIYENKGFSNKQAELKASEDLHSKYKKSLTKIYKQYILHMLRLEHNAHHNKIMEDVDYFINEMFYDLEEAVNIAVRKNKDIFEELLAEDYHSEDSEDEDSAGSEGVESDNNSEDENNSEEDREGSESENNSEEADSKDSEGTESENDSEDEDTEEDA